MGELTQQFLEEAEHQWLDEHPGCTVDDYERYVEMKGQEIERRERAEAIATRLQTTVEALRDGTYWIGQDGQKISISAIDKRYAKNLIRWFGERRKGLHDAACIWFMALPRPNGDQAQYAYDDDFDRLNEMEPAEWLNAQPLYKHLKLIADGKELKMTGKQQFTLRCSRPENGEIRETWVEAANKIEAMHKFLRRKIIAEWFLEGKAIKIEAFDPVEIEQEKQAKESALLDDDEVGPNGETVERPGDHQQPTPPGPPDPPYPPHHRPVG